MQTQPVGTRMAGVSGSTADSKTEEEKEEMKAITEKGGTWLLSGLLTTDEVDVRTAVEAMGLQWQHTLHKDGWISMRFADTGV